MNLKAPGSIFFRIAMAMLLTLVAQQSLLASEAEITQAGNLAEVASLSRQQGIPAIVFVSRDACPYCRTLRKTILAPMLAADKFESTAILIELSLDRAEPLTDFANKQVTPKDFAARYRAEITPTLLFLDFEGREVGKRIVGISNLELYGHYLQKSIDQALLAIHSGNQQN